jgi:hypothetical protein
MPSLVPAGWFLQVPPVSHAFNHQKNVVVQKLGGGAHRTNKSI